MKNIHLLLVSILFIGCSKAVMTVPKDEPIKSGGAYVLLSLKLDNTNDTLVISNSYSPKIIAEYSNGMVVDFSDSVQITALDNTVVLNNKKYYGVKSGVAKFEIKYKEYIFRDTINVTNVEYVPVPTELKSKNKGLLRVPVVIINYLPTKDGLELDRNRTQDSVGQDMTGPFYTLDRAKSKILKDKIIEKNAIEEGTKYHDYATNRVSQYIDIDVVAYINVYEMNYNYIGISSNYNRPWWNLDYNELMSRVGLEGYVNSLGVKEVWFTSFTREHGYLSYNVPESNMSPKQDANYYDVSNGGGGMTDLPRYKNTYVVYGYNGWRGVPEDLHNRGHQLERQMMFIDNTIWSDEFAKVGRCGNTHWASNSTVSGIYSDMLFVKSDIMTWKPSGGTYININSNFWLDKKYQFESQITDGMFSNSTSLTGTVNYANDAQVKWFIFWWQSVPGYTTNPIVDTYRGNKITLTNWWDIFYNWDDNVNKGAKLFN